MLEATANEFCAVQVHPLQEVYDGDLAIGENLMEWVASEVDLHQVARALLSHEITYLPLAGLSLHPWSAYRQFQSRLQGTYREDLEQAAAYDCPYLGHVFSGLIPLGVLTAEPEKYRPAFVARGRGDYLYDYYTSDMAREGTASDFSMTPFENILNSIQLSLMGSGFTETCLPSDGENERKPVVVNLYNGDRLLCACWIWYNN